MPTLDTTGGHFTFMTPGGTLLRSATLYLYTQTQLKERKLQNEQHNFQEKLGQIFKNFL